jgi:hypothetical protein
LIHGERVTRVLAGVSVEATLLQKSCDFINDLQEMFRSFRAKLSLTANHRAKDQACHPQESMQIERNRRRLFDEIRDYLVRIDVKGFRHVEKFNDIQAPLANFEAGDLSL